MKTVCMSSVAQKIFLIPLALFLFNPLLPAQTSETDKPQYDVRRGNTNVFQTKTENVKGSPYYSDSWVAGKVILNDDTITEELQLNYNIYENKVVFQDGEVLRAYDPEDIKSFLLLNENGQLETQFANGFYHEKLNIKPSDLLRVVYKGETKLLAKHEVFFSKNSSRDPFSNIKYSEFKNTTRYYLLTEEGLTPTRLKRKAFINALPRHQEDLTHYVKAAKLKLNTERDARTLLYYYDSIKE